MGKTHHDGEPRRQNTSDFGWGNFDKSDGSIYQQCTDSAAANDAGRVKCGNVWRSNLENLPHHPDANVETVGPKTTNAVIKKERTCRTNGITDTNKRDKVLDGASIGARLNIEVLLKAR